MIIDPYTWHSLPIAAITPLTPSTVSVSLRRPDGYSFQAGQYAIVRVKIGDGLLMRQYSFASPPQSELLEFVIQREPNGSVSGWLCDSAKPNMQIEISQPFGGFVMKGYQSPAVLIAGRVGVAPFLSMIRDYELIGAAANLTLLYSARGQDDFCYPALLRDVDAVLFDTKTDGRLAADDLRPYVLPSTRFYLCGSKRFVDAIETMLVELGVSSNHLKRERFTLQ